MFVHWVTHCSRRRSSDERSRRLREPRRNGPLEALRGEPALLAAAQDVLRAALTALDAAGISRGLEARAPLPLLASGPGAAPQPAHSDAGRLDMADERVDAAQRARAAKGGNAAGQMSVPLTALLALAQPATLLFSGYSLAEDRALGDDSPAFPARKLPMVRRAVPAFHALVFGQHVVHAGDANGAEHHARMHIFLEHADVPVVPDSTSIVGALGEVVASSFVNEAVLVVRATRARAVPGDVAAPRQRLAPTNEEAA